LVHLRIGPPSLTTTEQKGSTRLATTAPDAAAQAAGLLGRLDLEVGQGGQRAVEGAAGAAEPEVIKKGKTAVEGEAAAEEKPEKPEKAEKKEKK